MKIKTIQGLISCIKRVEKEAVNKAKIEARKENIVNIEGVNVQNWENGRERLSFLASLQMLICR